MGCAQHARGFGVQDHLSWPFLDRAEFRRRVGEFLSDGFDLGLRCVYAADGPRELLEEDLAGLPHLQSALDRGALVLSVLGDLYQEGAPVDPDETLVTFAAATEEALAEGYAGLRIAADATSLLRSPEQLAAFAAWEHRADRYMTGHPFSAMCGFDRTQLTATATVALACLHPASRAGITPFRIYASDEPADLALAGDLDMPMIASFRECLDRTRMELPRELVVDGTRLGFVDHRGLKCLRDFAGRSGATVVLRTRSELPGRLIGLLSIAGIRAERVTADGVLA